MSIDWSKAPAHATHWCPGNARIEEGWIYKAGQEFYSCYAEKSCEHIPNFPAWRALRLIPRPIEPAPWNGEGLPPVGTVCEYRVGDGPWFECEIRYVTKPYQDCPIEVVMFPPHLEGEQTAVVGTGDGEVSFRPISTPEQIAAEERIAELNKMIGCINDHPNKYPGATHLTQLKIQEDACIDLYDAGWRKQVTP